MPSLDFPRRHLASLEEIGARLLDSRKTGTASDTFARELLAAFHDVAMRTGQDGVLAALTEAHPGLDADERTGLADHDGLRAALAAQLDAKDLDGGGPRNARPRQLAEALVAALGLTPTEDVAPAITLDGRVRNEVTAALASVVEPELGRMRDAIIAHARALVAPGHHAAFDKIATQLDERAMRLVKQPKVPLDAMQASQRALHDAREAFFDRIVREAVDRARPILAAADAEAAARLARPVTHRLTPIDVAVRRAADARLPKQAAPVTAAVLDAISDTAGIAWRASEKPARTYSPSLTFAIGDLIEHPKFGRGTVVGALAQRIDVEFSEGKVTLIHMRGK